MSDNSEVPNIQTTCKLTFHGAAANSCPHSLLWVCAPVSDDEDDDGPNVACQDASGDADADVGPPTRARKQVQVADTVIYASSGVVNLATSHNVLSNNVTSIHSTLVTRTLDHSSAGGTPKKVLARGEAAEDAAAPRSITALAWVDGHNEIEKCSGELNVESSFGIVAAFSDGTVTSWRYDTYWMEHVLIGHDPPSRNHSSHHRENDVERSNLQESIADVSASNIDHQGGHSWIVATASSKGIILHLTHVTDKEEALHSRQIGYHAASSVRLEFQRANGERMKECYLFAGSASPRHNKIWVYTIPYSDGCDGISTALASLPHLTVAEPLHHGYLSGHQDWITCFSWLCNFSSSEKKDGRKESLLASSGHDAKIRLWKFSCRITSKEGDLPELEAEDKDRDSNVDNSDGEDYIDELEEEEGEARLIINHSALLRESTAATHVSLEALLLGHEEAVTSLTWKSQSYGEEKPCLLSSSMDRTILLWMEEDYLSEGSTSVAKSAACSGGVWVPISRVGSAGGILGGSVGASLMGFVDAAFSPDTNRIVGHGYGGSIHFWTQIQPKKAVISSGEERENKIVTAQWLADPCITGHFRSVEDMAWEPHGEYLLTVSSDQTTRLWTEVPATESHIRWVEVGRPQVHGYDMTSIVCIGGDDSSNTAGDGEPCHRFVSGADEKVIRVFDAPASTLRILRSIKQCRLTEGDGTHFEENQLSSWRVERAFLPSLGLSNKASADTDQESHKYAGPSQANNDDFIETLDTVEGESATLRLPSERDLGVTTLWPETRKLFGHESELVCLDAYCTKSASDHDPTLVASSCKARNDVASAAIRLWDAKGGKCVGILKGGHRSTVSTMSFSQDGKYLASSGKDRRICIWKRVNYGPGFELCAAADLAHKRIVWSVNFCPERPDILASGSRDGSTKLWQVLEGEDGSVDIKELLRFEPMNRAKKEPITAVAFAARILKMSYGEIDHGILGVGTKSGHIEVWAVPFQSNANSADDDITLGPIFLYGVADNNSHFDAVKKISWRPYTFDSDKLNEGTMHLTLASCGRDNGVRIFDLTIRNEDLNL